MFRLELCNVGMLKENEKHSELLQIEDIIHRNDTLNIKVFIKRKVIERLFYLHEIREDEEIEKSLQDRTESE